MICECGATFRRLHPDENHCRCGAIYDGQGNEVGQHRRTLKVQREQPAPKKPENVGTALASLIPDWAVANKEGCGCRDFEAKMNRWGIAGCVGEHYDEIIEHLVKQTDKLIPLFRKIPESGRRVMAKKLLNMAIEKTKKSI